MHVVIKEVGSVKDFINKKTQMEELAGKCYERHKRDFQGQWKHGEPVRTWESCLTWKKDWFYVEYEDGSIYAYQEGGECIEDTGRDQF